MRNLADLLWTDSDLRCVMTRTATGFEVCVQLGSGQPFIRKAAHSRGDARNQGEFLRVLLDRSRAAEVRPISRQPIVLVVEDDPDNLFAYEEILKLEGFGVASAASAADARRLAGQVKPSAALLDHVLPDGNGSDLCAMLRASAGEDLPVIVVTGLDPRDVTIGDADCPDAVMSKPCRPDLLTALLRLLVMRAKPAVDAAAQRAAAIEAPAVHHMSVRCPLCGAFGAELGPNGQFSCESCGREGTLRRDQFIDLG